MLDKESKPSFSATGGGGAVSRSRLPDCADLCYVDCARAIALIQTAPALTYSTYNIGGGRAVTNAEVVAAIRLYRPGFAVKLADGRSDSSPPVAPVLDLARIREDTDYEPAYALEAGVGEYIDWLSAGHPL